MKKLIQLNSNKKKKNKSKKKSSKKILNDMVKKIENNNEFNEYKSLYDGCIKN